MYICSTYKHPIMKNAVQLKTNTCNIILSLVYTAKINTFISYVISNPWNYSLETFVTLIV